MPQRRTPLSPLFLGFCLLLSVSPLFGQTAVPDENGHLVFKANARTVIVDVVVTGHDGKPVPGLRKEDFELAEDGHGQQLSFFEEHKGLRALPANLPDLPPNVFTNLPRVTPVDAVTVLLLDSLNTQVADQSSVHTLMLKYLATIQPGRRMAIFTLGNRLRYIQGFTSDPALLMAVMNRVKSGTGPQASPLLRSNAQESAEQTALDLIAEAQASSPSPVFQVALERLKQYQADQTAFQNDQRVKITLDALQQLGQYLAGIPGRKNVVWFSGSFPLVLFPNPNLIDSFSVEREYVEQVRKTDQLLAAAEVAIYPVAAQGLGTDNFYASSQRFTGVTITNLPGQAQPLALQTTAQQAQESQLDHLQDESVRRNADNSTMEQIASETGGEAFYNTNGLNEALDRVADHGSHFYTLAYTPSNAAPDGKFRKLQLKLARESTGGSYKLAYRRGYYAAGSKAGEAAAVKASADPLHPFMGPGMPESTQILYALRMKTVEIHPVDESSPEIVKHSTPVTNDFGRVQMAVHTELQGMGDQGQVPFHAGDNPKLKGKLTRYSVDFVIAAHSLQFDDAPGGGKHGSVEATLVAYDREGKALNWLVRQVDLDLDATRYAQVRQNGVNFRLEIDVPKGCASVRSGVYDRDSSLAGSLEVPLQSVLVGQAPGLKMR